MFEEFIKSLFGEKGNLGDLIGGIGQAGVAGYGYKDLMDQIGTQRDLTKGLLDQATLDAKDAGEFKGYGVTGGGVGTTWTDPATGQTTYSLNAGQEQQRNQLAALSRSMYDQSAAMDPRLSGQMDSSFGAANDFRTRSMMDTGAREADIYSRIRAMQMPEETRQYDSMNAGLFGSGRGGMQTDAYGGTPEQMAFGKAQAEARNAASYQAINQAQQEMMNYGNMANMYGQAGQSAFGAGLQGQQTMGQLAGQYQQGQYLPINQLMAMNQQGMQGGQMMNQSGQAMAGLLAQLGIGQATTDVNYSNIEGEAYTGLMKALGSMFGGLGSGGAA